jgi:hypothetical protein
MLRNGGQESLLVVEGESDSLTLTPHINMSKARIVVGYGRESVEEAIRLSDQNQLERVVAIADSDVDRHIPRVKTFSSPNLIRTQNYDLEADILFAENFFEHLLYSQASRETIEAFLVANGTQTALDTLVKLAGSIGMTRVKSVENGYGLMLRELPLGAFLLTNSTEFDFLALSAAIRSKSKHPKIDNRRLISLLKRSFHLKSIDLTICCGHDLVCLLAGALTKWWGVNVKYGEIARMLRAALSRETFTSMRVYIDVKRWSDDNSCTIWAT